MSIIIANSEAQPGLETALGLVKKKSSPLDIIEMAIREIETDPDIHSVGLGSWPNALGEIELDAAIMDGNTRDIGVIGALKGFLHPISVARKVMTELPHTFLAGDGAARYADEIGAERGELLTDVCIEAYNQWLDQVVDEKERDRWPNIPLSGIAAQALDPVEPLGTTALLAMDDHGSIAAGVSTSGWAWKYPGRLGDSPVIGAGCYADSRYGAAACTGKGELTMRACTSYSIVNSMRMGLSVREACLLAADDLADLERPFRGVVTIHALSKDGEHCVLRVGDKVKTDYFLWSGKMRSFQKKTASVAAIKKARR
ncbi:MAG: N(4)-(beta-N-acetylglucosaminyl)-L-asparaginase [Spirochaetales bacterium]|jgi:L-asparaginase / beta-aspartyl-peptidase|nr:N(4)-(beta-N-acetylglucosaminyl)-L-asparaginase [Spirochaetales bacterium]